MRSILLAPLFIVLAATTAPSVAEAGCRCWGSTGLVTTRSSMKHTTVTGRTATIDEIRAALLAIGSREDEFKNRARVLEVLNDGE